MFWENSVTECKDLKELVNIARELAKKYPDYDFSYWFDEDLKRMIIKERVRYDFTMLTWDYAR